MGRFIAEMMVVAMIVGFTIASLATMGNTKTDLYKMLAPKASVQQTVIVKR